MSIEAIDVKVKPELVAVLAAQGRSVEAALEEHAILDLYRVGAISDHNAARLLGMDLGEFMRWAGERGVPYARYPAEEVRSDVAALLGLLDRKG